MFEGSAPVKLTREAIEQHLDNRTLVVRMRNGRVWDSLRRNGKTQLWKREPNRFRIPVKFGFKNCGEITQDTEIVLLADGRFAIRLHSEGIRAMLSPHFWCSMCDERKWRQPDGMGGTGYAKNSHGSLICYACCADVDRAYMREHGRNTMYLVRDKGGNYSVQNWCGTLKLPCHAPARSRHNIARWRYDVWFRFNGQRWHGVQYGDNTQICRVKKVKGKG